MTTPRRDAISVLVPAAGSGERLGLGPKALLPLDGRMMLEWVVRKAMRLADEVIVACPVGADPVLDPDCQWLRIDGGATRQGSVARLAQAADRPWLVVWDAARPFTSLALVESVLTAATTTTGAAAAVLPDGSFQTPLAFAHEVLLDAVARSEREGWTVATTTGLVLRAGHAVATVRGDPLNLKITTAADWTQAQDLLPRLRLKDH